MTVSDAKNLNILKRMHLRNSLESKVIQDNILTKPMTLISSGLGGFYGYNYTEEDAPLGGKVMGAARGAASGLGLGALGTYAGSRLSNAIMSNTLKNQNLREIQENTKNVMSTIYNKENNMIEFTSNRYNQTVNFSNVQQVINRGTNNPTSADDSRVYKELAGSKPKLGRKFGNNPETASSNMQQVKAYLRGRYNNKADATPTSLGLVKSGYFPKGYPA